MSDSTKKGLAQTQRIEPWLSDTSLCMAWVKRTAKEDAINANFRERIAADAAPTSLPPRTSRAAASPAAAADEPLPPLGVSLTPPVRMVPPTSDAFHSSPYHTAARQVHSWTDYHDQRNPFDMHARDPAFPEHSALMRTETAMSNEGLRSVQPPLPAAGDLEASPRKPAGALSRSGAREEALFASHPRPASVHPRFYAVDETIIPRATKHNVAIARQMRKDPQGVHAHSATVTERSFKQDPQAGMQWTPGKGWYVPPERPSVDLRFVSGGTIG